MPQTKRQPQKEAIDAPLARPLSKSRFKIASECPTKLFYTSRPKEYANDKSEDPFLRNLARGGFQVGALAQAYFAGGTEIRTLDYEKSLSETAELLTNDSAVIFESAFRYQNLFVRADITERDGSVLRLFEVKAKSFHPDYDEFWQKRKPDHLNNDWKEYLYDVAFQHYVIQNSHPELKVIPYLYLVNKAATTTVEALNQRFRLVKENGRERVVTDPALTKELLGAEILVRIDVSKEVAAIQSGKANGDDPPDWPTEYTFSTWVEYLSLQYLSDNRIPPKVTGACKDCEFRVESSNYPNLKNGFEECWTEALTLKPGTFQNRKPIFEIWKLIAPPLIKDGIYFLDQLSEDDLAPKSKSRKEPKPGLTTAQRKVVQWERTLTELNKTFFDKKGFLLETSDLKFPLHFIDFETTTVAIPFNKGRRPYELVAFQFSHHTLQKDGTVAHSGQWINTEPGIFPNYAFVRALKEALSTDQGTIFRYAAHENTVLCQIREQLRNATLEEVPDREALISWIETIASPPEKCTTPWEPVRPMVDLLDLVLRYFWHPRMKGSNSIKVVLPAILEDSEFLKRKYQQPIYGAKDGIRSLNYSDHVWVRIENGKQADPYQLLPPVFDNWDRAVLDRLYGDDELADGGAAMMAYAKMQFSEMNKAEREKIAKALLRYCELDTLAMVMLWEGWIHSPDTDSKV